MQALGEYDAAGARLRRGESPLDEGGLEMDLKEMVQAELAESKGKLGSLTQQLRLFSSALDENDGKSVIVEIRAGAGGEEAALFARSLYRMYGMYAAGRGWQCEELNLNETELGGVKEISFRCRARALTAA